MEVIVLHYVNVSNQKAVHLELTQCCMPNYISVTNVMGLAVLPPSLLLPPALGTMVLIPGATVSNSAFNLPFPKLFLFWFLFYNQVIPQDTINQHCFLYPLDSK